MPAHVQTETARRREAEQRLKVVTMQQVRSLERTSLAVHLDIWGFVSSNSVLLCWQLLPPCGPTESQSFRTSAALLVALQKAASRSTEDDTLLSIKVGGADITAPLAFLALFGGVYYGWQQSKGAARKQQKGRWVYDRSLGGKRVGH